jgi:hypothetical protein
MGEGDDLAGGATRAARDDRVPAVVEAVGDERAQRRADPGVAAQEAGQPQQHGAPHHRLGQRRTGSGGPAGKDRALERGLIDVLDRPTGEVAESGVDPVGGGAGFQVGKQGAATPPHAVEERGLKRHRLAVENDPAVDG